MKRRDFVAGFAAVGALAACGKKADGPVIQSGERIRWRLVSSFPRSLDSLYGAAERFCDRVKALTSGRFEIEPYQAGEIVPALQVLDAVGQGTVQMGQTAGYYFTGKNPALAFDTCVPFGFSARQQNAWLHYGGGIELLRPVFADFGVVNIPSGNTGTQMGGWFRTEVNSAADLNGFKMRIPGLGGEIMTRMGATVQVLPGGEAYTALERGAIDAAEWVGPYDDEKLGFQNAAKFYYYPGWWEPSASLSHLINKSAWEKLPKDYQNVIETASNESALTMTADYDAKNPAALERLIAGGTALRKFSDEIMTRARAESETALEEKAAADAGYRKIYDSWKKFRTESFRWFGTSELAYAEFAFKKP